MRRRLFRSKADFDYYSKFNRVCSNDAGVSDSRSNEDFVP